MNDLAIPSSRSFLSARAVDHLPLGPLALVVLAVVSMGLIAMARLGAFALWPLSLPLVVLAVLAGLRAWWNAAPVDRAVIAVIVFAGALLYTPPGEHYALVGDADIYPDTGALIARTGSDSGTYEPLAPLSPDARTLFYVSASEQLSWMQIRSYDGLVYGAYYLADLSAPTLTNSRPPLAAAWLALLIRLAGLQAALYLTPVAGILGLILVYLVGREAFGRLAGAWAALLLGLSYSQVLFARSSYAEIYGQVWVFAGLFFALRWTKQRRPVWLVTALLMWVIAWSARLDAMFLLGAADLLIVLAVVRRDGRSLRAAAAAAPLLAVLVLLGTNAAYVGASFETYWTRWPWFTVLIYALAAGLVLVPLAFYLWGGPILTTRRRAAPLIHGGLFVLAAFAVLWSTVPNPWRDAAVTRDYQEILWFSSQYVSPILFWLALAGVGWLLWRGYNAGQFVLLFTLVSLAGIFFFRYTTSPYYPVSLRRLSSEVFPLMAIMAGAALAALWPLGRWRYLSALAGAAAACWILVLSWPVIQQHEFAGTTATIEALHGQAPDGSALIFEPQNASSFVGWLSSPLYSIYGDTALELKTDTPDPALYARAVQQLQAEGKTVIVVSQHAELPAPLVPPGFRAAPAFQSSWRSSIIVQTRQPYPPPYAEFDYPIYAYRLVP